MNNTHIFIIIMMVFCHIVDDYYLQGILANMKQRKWWVKNAPDALYRYDYVFALIIHSLSWSIMMSLPLIGYIMKHDINNAMFFIAAEIIFNTIIHGIMDNMKANEHKINLWIDQIIHFIQILGTAVCFFIII